MPARRRSDHASRRSATAEKVGLIAGWGRYPLVVAEALAAQGAQVYCLGIKDHADPALAELCDEFDWIGLGKIGRVIRFFRRHGVTPGHDGRQGAQGRLFERWAWLHHLPDWQGVRTYYPHFVSAARAMQDDSLLGTIVDSFDRGGITMKPATDFVPELLVKTRLPDRRAADRRPSSRTSSSAGSWPRRWAGSTSARAWP